MWESDELQDLLPNRTSQSMREQARRLKARIEAAIEGEPYEVTPKKSVPRSVNSTLAPPVSANSPPSNTKKRGISESSNGGSARKKSKANFDLRDAMAELMTETGQSLKNVTWALYQVNGRIKKAKKILLGLVAEKDFTPWVGHDDNLITKYTGGILDSEEQALDDDDDICSNIMAVDRVKSDKEGDNIRKLLSTRPFPEIVARARFLRNPEEVVP